MLQGEPGLLEGLEPPRTPSRLSFLNVTVAPAGDISDQPLQNFAPFPNTWLGLVPRCGGICSRTTPCPFPAAGSWSGLVPRGRVWSHCLFLGHLHCSWGVPVLGVTSLVPCSLSPKAALRQRGERSQAYCPGTRGEHAGT